MARQTAPARPKASSLAQGRSALFRVTALLPAGAFRSPKNQTPSAERTALLPRKGLFVTLCCTIISLGNLFFWACQPGMRFWTIASDSAIFRIGWQKSGNSAAPLSLPGGLVTKKFSVTLHPLKIAHTRQKRHASLLPQPRTPVAHCSAPPPTFHSGQRKERPVRSLPRDPCFHECRVCMGLNATNFPCQRHDTRRN